LLIAILLWIAMYLLFNTLPHVPWPPSLLGDAFPQLRSMLAGQALNNICAGARAADINEIKSKILK
jgi:hypothetical protein